MKSIFILMFFSLTVIGYESSLETKQKLVDIQPENDINISNNSSFSDLYPYEDFSSEDLTTRGQADYQHLDGVNINDSIEKMGIF